MKKKFLSKLPEKKKKKKKQRTLKRNRNSIIEGGERSIAEARRYQRVAALVIKIPGGEGEGDAAMGGTMGRRKEKE